MGLDTLEWFREVLGCVDDGKGSPHQHGGPHLAQPTQMRRMCDRPRGESIICEETFSCQGILLGRSVLEERTIQGISLHHKAAGRGSVVVVSAAKRRGSSRRGMLLGLVYSVHPREAAAAAIL